MEHPCDKHVGDGLARTPDALQNWLFRVVGRHDKARPHVQANHARDGASSPKLKNILSAHIYCAVGNGVAELYA